MKNHMAIDQFGNTLHNLGKYPRKALMEKNGVKSCKKMYCDTTSGESYHRGWVVSGHWYSVYEVIPMRRPV